jgi:hypothetical protein
MRKTVIFERIKSEKGKCGSKIRAIQSVCVENNIMIEKKSRSQKIILISQ